MGKVYKSWTTGEIEDLRYLRTVERLRIREIAEILERSERTIEEATHHYGIRIEEPWKEQELELLKKLVFDTGNKKKEIARRLGRTENAVRSKMIEMFGSSGLTKLRNESFLNRAEARFTEKEIKFLQEFYYIKGAKACASALKRTKYSVTLKAGRLMRQGYEFKKPEEENTLSGTDKNGVELSSVENNVKSPKHYRLEGLNIESIDVIRATLGKEGFKAFCKGNIMKYLIRAEKKNGLEDYKKAQIYLGWYLKECEEEKTGSTERI